MRVNHIRAWFWGQFIHTASRATHAHILRACFTITWTSLSRCVLHTHVCSAFCCHWNISVVSVFVSRFIVFFFTLARHNAGEKVAINNTMILEKKIWTEKVIVFFFCHGYGNHGHRETFSTCLVCNTFEAFYRIFGIAEALLFGTGCRHLLFPSFVGKGRNKTELFIE